MSPVRPTVVQAGIATAFGCMLEIAGATSAVRETVRAFMNGPEGSVQALLWLANDREFFRSMVASEEAALGDFDRIRKRAQADLSAAQRLALEVHGLLASTESAGQDLRRALADFGIGQQELLDRWSTADDMPQRVYGRGARPDHQAPVRGHEVPGGDDHRAEPLASL